MKITKEMIKAFHQQLDAIVTAIEDQGKPTKVYVVQIYNDAYVVGYLGNKVNVALGSKELKVWKRRNDAEAEIRWIVAMWSLFLVDNLKVLEIDRDAISSDVELI